ncbi:IS701 family transposase [Methanospirillum stamsii]|uniref:IS701 family transposase n=1 Tax=Methanospirillum stamsii TaxID=1277351 RepID=UPI00248289BD|nr:IS701 family transposase [Methanospirillum stamsii]
MSHVNAFFNQASLQDCFSTKTHNGFLIAIDYMKGLLTSPGRRHLTAISQNCSDFNNQVFSHFMAQSTWDHRSLVEWIRNIGWRLIGKNGALVIDECANPKSGEHSVGVQRQYCGNLGKVENCQVGVFMAYVKNGSRLLLDYRLYLPKSWTSNSKRCDSAGIPIEHRTFKTKAELSYELIVDALRSKIPFSHVNMDGFYGSQPWLLTLLEALGVTYVADIGSDDRVFLEVPEYGIPLKCNPRGRPPSQVKVLNTTPIRVDEIMRKIKRWRILRVRRAMNGFLEVNFYALKVWRIDKDIQEPLPVWLLIRKELEEPKVKYSLCNGNHINSWDRLVKMQSERYWVERTFQDSIALAGMADYQVRNWKAWHHHVALVLLAMLWILREQKHLLPEFKDITPQDVARFFLIWMPLKEKTSSTVAEVTVKNKNNRKNSRRSKMKRKGRPIIE